MFGMVLLVLQALPVQSQTQLDNEIHNRKFPAATAICFPNSTTTQVAELTQNMCNSSQEHCQVMRYPLDGMFVNVNSSASDPRLEYCLWQLADDILCSKQHLDCENCTEMPCIRQSCLHCEWIIEAVSNTKIVVLLFNISATWDVQLDLEIRWDDSGSWNVLSAAEQRLQRIATRQMKLIYNTSSVIEDAPVTFITIVMIQSNRRFISKNNLYSGSAIVICLLLASILSSCICCLKHRKQKVLLSTPQTYKLTYRSETSAFSEEEKYAMLTRASKDSARLRTTSSVSNNSKSKEENEVSHRRSMFFFNIFSCLSPKRSSYSTVVDQLSDVSAYNEMDDTSIQRLLSKFDSLILTFERSNSSSESSFSDGDKLPVTVIELLDGKYFCSEQLLDNSAEASETKSSEEVFSCKSSDESVHSFFSVHPQHCNSDMDSFTSVSYDIEQ